MRKLTEAAREELKKLVQEFYQTSGVDGLAEMCEQFYNNGYSRGCSDAKKDAEASELDPELLGIVKSRVLPAMAVVCMMEKIGTDRASHEHIESFIRAMQPYVRNPRETTMLMLVASGIMVALSDALYIQAEADATSEATGRMFSEIFVHVKRVAGGEDLEGELLGDMLESARGIKAEALRSAN